MVCPFGSDKTAASGLPNWMESGATLLLSCRFGFHLPAPAIGNRDAHSQKNQPTPDIWTNRGSEDSALRGPAHGAHNRASNPSNAAMQGQGPRPLPCKNAH